MSFDVLTIDYHKPDASERFVHSLHHTGFAVIQNHPISSQLMDATYEDWQKFFASDEKMKHLYNPSANTHTGYFPFRSENARGNPIKNLMEYYHYRQWQGVPDGMRNNTALLYQQLNQLAATLLAWIEQHLPAENKKYFQMPLPDMITDCKRTLIRIIHYPPLTGAEEPGAMRAAEHNDSNLITLLPAATESGLQVQDNQGAWHDVSCDPGTITVNAGDTLRILTEDYLPATVHRVNNPVGELAKKSRLSMPMFVHPYGDIRLPDGRTDQEYWIDRMREEGVHY